MKGALDAAGERPRSIALVQSQTTNHNQRYILVRKAMIVLVLYAVIKK